VCRRRKLKCDRSLPCGQCLRSKTPHECVFVGPQPGPAEPPQMSPPVSQRANNEPDHKSGIFVFDSKLGANSSRGTKRARPDELHELRSRLRQLENSVGRPVLQTPETSIGDVFSPSEGETTNSSENVGVEDRVRFLPDSSFRGKRAKTRYFGRSHYTTTISFVSA
jgi:hypothetical protein